MLSFKNTTLFSEIGTYFKENDSSEAIFILLRFLRSFNLSLDVLNLRDKPNAEFSRAQTLILLILSSFFSVKNVAGYANSYLNKLFKRHKDLFYRFLSDGSIEWRKVLYCFNRQLLHKIAARSDSQHSNDPICLIIDDTDFPKTGRKSEMLGYIYSHVKKSHILGYKGLFLLRSDGKTQTVLDYSVHGEIGKNKEKLYGMKPSERKKQFHKKREERENAVRERVSEYDKSKISTSISMVKRAVKYKIKYDYLLADSWFACTEIIRYIKTRAMECHYLGMIKMGNTKYEYEGKFMTSKEIIQTLSLQRGRKWSRKMGFYHIECQVKLDGMDVKLFFYRRTKRGKWVGLMTTNRSLSYIQALKIYSMRWSIEVFFKESKGLLGLGKYQTRNFASLIAEISITALQFNILSTAKRFTDYETLGGLFREISSDTVKLSVTDRIWKTVTKILQKLADIYLIDIKEIIYKLIDAGIHLGPVSQIRIKT